MSQTLSLKVKNCRKKLFIGLRNVIRVKEVFLCILILKMGAKMNVRMIRKNHAADLEKGFPTKSILKSDPRTPAMPTAWELIYFFNQESF